MIVCDFEGCGGKAINSFIFRDALGNAASQRWNRCIEHLLICEISPIGGKVETDIPRLV
jgi:hypothetical protein